MGNFLHKEGSKSYTKNRPIEYYRDESVEEAIKKI